MPLHVTARDLGTSSVHAGRRVFDFELLDPRLVIRMPDAHDRGFDLEPLFVASLYRQFLNGDQRDDRPEGAPQLLLLPADEDIE